MAKKPASDEAAKMVSVKLKCVYSGWKVETKPGDVIDVDEAEANRLVAVGGAELA